jgi:hypothetical protein
MYTQSFPRLHQKYRKNTQLYYTNAEMNETNFARLSRPVKKIGAQHKGHDAHKAAKDEVNNLPLHLCIGARFMLTTDLWTENRLFYSE